MAYKVTFDRALNEEIGGMGEKGERSQSRDPMSTSPRHTSVLGLELSSTQSNTLETEMDQMLVGEASAPGNFCCVGSRGNGERELIKKMCKLRQNVHHHCDTGNHKFCWSLLSHSSRWSPVSFLLQSSIGQA